MAREYTINLFSASDVTRVIREIGKYTNSIDRKGREICRRLAEYGVLLAENAYDGTHYDGERNVYVTVEDRDNGFAVLADGEAVLFLEFGAGITYGYGHPEAGKFGMGPGTYPSDKGHWNDPNGWWIPGGEHTYGNAPTMAMYNTSKTLRDTVEKVAREVFSE